MSSFTRTTAVAVALSILFASTSLTLAQSPHGGADQRSVEVGVISMASQSVPMVSVMPGRVVASATAAVRPQVGGLVTEVRAQEGQTVQPGDVLFTIDREIYEADVAVAKASLVGAEAQVPGARATLERYKALVGAGNVAQTELDKAEAALAQAEASLVSAQAGLRMAELALGRTDVTATIGGTVGAIAAQVGSLVTANQTDALTTIRQIDPVDIELAESSANLIALRQALSDGTLVGNGGHAPRLSLTLEDGTPYGEIGSLAAADVVVSPTTGSFIIRGTIANPDRMLLPGMFVRAEVSIGVHQGAFLVPQRAVSFNAAGEATAFFVSENGTAELRELVVRRAQDNNWLVTGGVASGDTLIVDGFQKFVAGSVVSPVPVSIQPDGTVVDLAELAIAEARP